MKRFKFALVVLAAVAGAPGGEPGVGLGGVGQRSVGGPVLSGDSSQATASCRPAEDRRAWPGTHHQRPAKALDGWPF